MSQTPGPQRPALITFVGILTYIQAFAALALGVMYLIGTVSDTVMESVGADSVGAVVAAGVVEVLFGLFFLFLARGIMGGAPWARLWLTIVAGFRIVAAGVMTTGVFVLDDVDNTGYGLLSILLPLAVLFVLWGTEKGQEFFAKK